MLADPNNRTPVSFVIVEANFAGQRLDNFLLARLKGLPKSRLYRILRKGEVRVNKGRVKPDYRVKEGDSVRIPPLTLPAEGEAPRVSSAQAQVLNEAILYEDDGLIVINKPAGLAVHGGSGISLGLIEMLRQVRSDCRHLELVHRLDRDTSGCLMIAKRRAVLREIHEALRNKTIDKYYTALAIGRWPKGLDRINAPLKKNNLQSGERMVWVSEDGKSAETRFSVLAHFERYSLIQAMPVTGRTHQIRVHAKAAGYPLCGDVKYGVDSENQRLAGLGAKHLFLHASQIDIPINGSNLRVDSPLPDSWQRFLDTLK